MALSLGPFLWRHQLVRTEVAFGPAPTAPAPRPPPPTPGSLEDEALPRVGSRAPRGCLNRSVGVGGGFLPTVLADQSPAGPDAYEDVVDGAQTGGLGKSKPGLLGYRSLD